MSEQPHPSWGDAVGAGPRRLGRYVLHHLVAHGGMASVFLGRLSSPGGFHKWVAIKTVHPHVAADPTFVQMFMHEAQLAARIDHPNVCPVFDFGEADGTYFLAMEYMHGESLSEVCRSAWKQRGLPVEIATRIVADAAYGLHAAHELRTADGAPAEVVHRDVSPQNLFVLYSGVSKVLDFGIARSNDRSGIRTATGELKGKVAYMSPEQLQFAEVDRRTDVWALGVLLWETTVGERLFKRDTEPLTIVAVMMGTIPKPSEICPDYPADLEAIVLRAVERDAAKRYATAADLARDLELFLARRAVPSGPTAVADFMESHFGPQRVRREATLQRYVAELPSPDLDALVMPATAAARARARASGVPASGGSAPARARWRLAAGVVAGVAVAGAIAVVARLTAPVRNEGERPFVAAPRAAPAAVARGIAAAPATVPEAVVTADAGAARRVADDVAPEPHVAPGGGGERVATIVAVAPAPARARDEPPHHGSHRPHGARSPEGHAPSESHPPGYLNLIHVPSVEVFEGHTSLGFTPLVRRAMSPGRHRLRLAAGEGSPARTVTVDITSGQTVARSVH